MRAGFVDQTLDDLIQSSHPVRIDRLHLASRGRGKLLPAIHQLGSLRRYPLKPKSLDKAEQFKEQITPTLKRKIPQLPRRAKDKNSNSMDPFMRMTNDLSDHDLLKEINRIAANLSHLGTFFGTSIKGITFMDTYVDGMAFPDTTHIYEGGPHLAKLIACHPHRHLRNLRSIELECEARITLQKAANVLVQGKRRRAEKLLEEARRLIAQSNDTSGAAASPTLDARQRAGGRATAKKQRILKSKIDEEVAKMIRNLSLATSHLESHSKVAYALKTDLATFLHQQKESLNLPNATRAKILMHTRKDGSLTTSFEAENYAYRQIKVLLAKPAPGAPPTLTRQAFEELVATHRVATTESDSSPSTSGSE